MRKCKILFSSILVLYILILTTPAGLISAKELFYVNNCDSIVASAKNSNNGILITPSSSVNFLTFGAYVSVATASTDRITFYLDMSEYAKSDAALIGKPVHFFINIITASNKTYQFKASANSSYMYYKALDTFTISDKGNYGSSFKGFVSCDISAFFDGETRLSNETIKAIYFDISLPYNCTSEIFIGDLYGFKQNWFIIADFSEFSDVEKPTQAILTTCPSKDLPDTFQNNATSPNNEKADSSKINNGSYSAHRNNADNPDNEATTKFKGSGKNYIEDSPNKKDFAESEKSDTIRVTDNNSESAGGVFDENGKLISPDKKVASFELTENKSGTEAIVCAVIFSTLIGSSVYLVNSSRKQQHKTQPDIKSDPEKGEPDSTENNNDTEAKNE